MDTAPPPKQQSATLVEMSFNPRYLITPSGLLRIIEVLLGLLCWALTAEISPYSSAHQFVMFVSVTSWILSLGLLFVYLFSLNATKLSEWPWSLIEFIFNGFWAVFYFVAACVSAAYTYHWGQLIAATVFAFFTAIAYGLHGLFEFMEWRGSPIGNPRADGVQVNA